MNMALRAGSNIGVSFHVGSNISSSAHGWGHALSTNEFFRLGELFRKKIIDPIWKMWTTTPEVSGDMKLQEISHLRLAARVRQLDQTLVDLHHNLKSKSALEKMIQAAQAYTHYLQSSDAAYLQEDFQKKTRQQIEERITKFEEKTAKQ